MVAYTESVSPVYLYSGSRVTSRPLVSAMVQHYTDAIGEDHGRIMRAFDVRTEEAMVTMAAGSLLRPGRRF